MNPPLVFIHYGNSSYLKFTLRAARLFNPQKPIILLGDDRNDHFTRFGLEHHNFADYASGPEIELFDCVYRFIGGRKHPDSPWVKFVFRRWFHLYCFLSAHGIEQFWTFDTDTLLLTSLAAQEHKYLQYDCTEQCGGSCMNGLVNNLRVVKGYLDKINELFQREDYLQRQRQDFEVHPEYAFTEMRAFVAYKQECRIRTIRLSSVVNGEAFDDCLCVAEDMEPLDRLPDGLGPLRCGLPKKLYMSPDGRVYCHHLPTGTLVKMNSLNLSWLPDYLFPRILNHAKRQLRRKPQINVERASLPRLDLKRSVRDRIARKTLRVCQHLHLARRHDLK